MSGADVPRPEMGWLTYRLSVGALQVALVLAVLIVLPVDIVLLVVRRLRHGPQSARGWKGNRGGDEE